MASALVNGPVRNKTVNKRSAASGSADGKPSKRVRSSTPSSPSGAHVKNKEGQKKKETESRGGGSDRDGDDYVSSSESEGAGGLEAVLPNFDDIEGLKKYKLAPKYTRSIYVDAFNLCLDTVLQNELHLFSDEEAEIFVQYQSLEYELQHLYVRLFLRKQNAWFRESKLSYSNDIADIPMACAKLKSPDVGFAESEQVIDTLEEAADLLSLQELCDMARKAKCSTANITKAGLIDALKKASGSQTGLAVKGQLRLKFDEKGRYVNQNNHFVRKILDKAGPCIRLTTRTTDLFRRVHVAFHRSTIWTETTLTTMILARISRLNFPEYRISRGNIFADRASLLEFEQALKLQDAVDEALNSPKANSKEGLECVKAIFEDIYDIWSFFIEGSKEPPNPDEAMEMVYLRRFTPAWVWTRIVHKGAHVLGRLKEYTREHAVLTQLLSQKNYHPGRRGGWYQRKALVEENYMYTSTTAMTNHINRQNWNKEALQTCITGLQDPQTHLIYHHDLQKRITRLQTKLRVASRSQLNFHHNLLLKPTERTITGVQILPTDGAVAAGKKTVWRSTIPGAGAPSVSVEELCLEHYRTEGWKGFHSEGAILKTLFAYLFYDILFLPVPNVFHTEFQSSPLDLGTDTFYLSRAAEINARLLDLSHGSAPTLIEALDSAHRARRTTVVGLNWDFTKQDLVEIARCIGGPALAAIFKVVCQDYRERGSGIPDLFLWKPVEGECLFSEVKSANDRVSDVQRLWMHVLAGVGVRVEKCSVVAVASRKVVKGEVDGSDDV